MSDAHVRRILCLLVREYGDRDWEPDRRPLATLIQTILSQNTSDTNSGRAFRSLSAAFPTWEEAENADQGAVAEAIRAGGLGEIKAGRIQAALAEIRRERGAYELDFLARLPMPEARDWLRSLPGVGTKTANCVLLFSVGQPALPVDTHVYRVTRRLGLVSEKASVERAHSLLEEAVRPADAYRFHVLVIEHGRRVCRARLPLCGDCVLWALCPGRREPALEPPAHQA